MVNIQPLGRPIKIRFGAKSETTVCYHGWVSTSPYQNLRVKITTAGATPRGCCVKITAENSPGEIETECTSAKNNYRNGGSCAEDVADESPHTLKKRNATRMVRNSFGETSIVRLNPEEESYFDVIGDTGKILPKRQAEDYDADAGSSSDITPNPNLINFGEDGDGEIIGKSRVRYIDPVDEDSGPASVITPRKLGIKQPREPETYRFQLLKKTIDIFLKVVPDDAVPHSMIQTAYDIFYYLYEELDPMIHNPPGMQKKAMEFLENCLAAEPVLNFTTYGCPREIKQLVVDEYVMKKLETYYEGQPEELNNVLKSLEHVEIRKDRRYVVELYDIYVEINWKVADFSNGDGRSINLINFINKVVLNFHLRLQMIIYRFSKAKDLRYARGILGTSNLKIRMQQLDKVAAVGHSLSRYNGTYWLHRPNVDPMLMYAEDSKISSGGSDGTREESRLAFAKHLMQEDEQFSEETLQSRRSSSEVVRHLSYPFHFPEKLPPGELIWDGLAVCLHAKYSNRRSYFLDSKQWGLTPTLQELGDLFPLSSG
ncbi:hypothetical protein Ocin01_12819 [Orchesella cincta]|uniref:Uncharacterized protein n=1 Tax=Orchesella cincta TaxID=48709 RepID=A0A1D2MLY6_ORCCI|nr:hypothetical protein Ocin01_12819 [Orchesella cincta]